MRGRDLAGASPSRIAAMLRAGWRQQGVGDLVAVDEVTPAQWTPSSAAGLAAALDQLGPDAQRVIFYAAPAMVERVGRADPRAALPAPLGQLIDAMSRARATYLLTYRGDLSPFPAREMAMHPTRWAVRWPAGRGELRIMLGPDAGLGQREVWARVRVDRCRARPPLARPRRLRARHPRRRAGLGVPVPGVPRVADRLDHGRRLPGPDARRAHPDRRRRQPGAGAHRPPRARRRDHGARRRAEPCGRSASSPDPTSGDVVVRVPTDTRPGRYRVQAVLIGDGLKDRAAVVVRVKR